MLVRKQNRPLTRFHGDACVIGCSCTLSNSINDFLYNRTHHLHENKDRFYSIDYDQKVNPDYILDIERDQIPSEMKRKFNFVLLEFLPAPVYSNSNGNRKNITFNNLKILELLDKKNGGILLIQGNVANKFPTDATYTNTVNYKITEKTQGGAAIIIYAPQDVSLHLIIKSLNEDAQSLISHLNLYPNVQENKYNVDANSAYIKNKAVQIIQRQIDLLSGELKQDYIINPLVKKEKRKILENIKSHITTNYPNQNMKAIINEASKDYPDLESGFLRHTTKDNLDIIRNMDEYHEKMKLSLGESLPHYKNPNLFQFHEENSGQKTELLQSHPLIRKK